MYYFRHTELNELYEDMYRTLETILKMDDHWIEDALVQVNPNTLEVKYVDCDDIVDAKSLGACVSLDMYPALDFFNYDENAEKYYINERSLVKLIEKEYFYYPSMPNEYKMDI